MKKCPFCELEIQDVAIKCKHCKKWLEEKTVISVQPSQTEVKKDNRIFYIISGLAAFLIVFAVVLSLRYEEADFENFRYRYDRFTQSVYRANIVALTRSSDANKAGLWRKTRYVSLLHAISEEQRSTREEAAYQQRQAMDDTADKQRRAMDDEAETQRQAIEDAADEQRQAMDDAEYKLNELKRHQDDMEFQKMQRRR